MLLAIVPAGHWWAEGPLGQEVAIENTGAGPINAVLSGTKYVVTLIDDMNPANNTWGIRTNGGVASVSAPADGPSTLVLTAGVDNFVPAGAWAGGPNPPAPPFFGIDGDIASIDLPVNGSSLQLQGVLADVVNDEFSDLVGDVSVAGSIGLLHVTGGIADVKITGDGGLGQIGSDMANQADEISSSAGSITSVGGSGGTVNLIKAHQSITGSITGLDAADWIEAVNGNIGTQGSNSVITVTDAVPLLTTIRALNGTIWSNIELNSDGDTVGDLFEATAQTIAGNINAYNIGGPTQSGTVTATVGGIGELDADNGISATIAAAGDIAMITAAGLIDSNSITAGGTLGPLTGAMIATNLISGDARVVGVASTGLLDAGTIRSDNGPVGAITAGGGAVGDIVAGTDINGSIQGLTSVLKIESTGGDIGAKILPTDPPRVIEIDDGLIDLLALNGTIIADTNADQDGDAIGDLSRVEAKSVTGVMRGFDIGSGADGVRASDPGGAGINEVRAANNIVGEISSAAGIARVIAGHDIFGSSASA